MKLNLVTLAVVIIGLSLFGMQAASAHLPWTAWRIAGIAIAAPAFLLLVAARIELGRAFSVQAKATITSRRLGSDAGCSVVSRLLQHD